MPPRKATAPKQVKSTIHADKRTNIPTEELEEVCAESYSDFAEKYRVYSLLKDAGYIVAPGIKFGTDFAVYEHGPGIDHAPFIVQVEKAGNEINAMDMVRSGRLATTVRKQFIIAVVSGTKEKVEFLAFDWWRA